MSSEHITDDQVQVESFGQLLETGLRDEFRPAIPAVIWLFRAWLESADLRPAAQPAATHIGSLNTREQIFQNGYRIGFKAGQQKVTAAPAAQPVGDVPVPTTEDQAAAMQMLGQAWLEQHAPHRLKDAQAVGWKTEALRLFDLYAANLLNNANAQATSTRDSFRALLSVPPAAQPVWEPVGVVCGHESSYHKSQLSVSLLRFVKPGTSLYTTPQPVAVPDPIVDERGNAMVLAAHLAVETIAQMEQPQASWTVPVYVPADQAQKVLEAIRLERESDALHQAQVRAAVMRNHPQ